MYKKTILLFVFIIACAMQAQTMLQPGDIIITKFTASNPDEIFLVPLVNLEAGTIINYTDRGWVKAEDGNDYFSGVEETIKTFTAPNDIVAGTEIKLEDIPTLAISGDQILLFQGTTENPNFIFMVNFKTPIWTETGDTFSTNLTALPSVLESTGYYLSFPEEKNAIYWPDGTNNPDKLEGTKAELLAYILMPENWAFFNSYFSDEPTNFTVTDAETLPVELTSFTADWTAETGVQIQWETASETSMLGFEIYRSEELNENYEKINSLTISANNTTFGAQYTFTDDNPTGEIVYYRLCCRDLDGSETWSEAIEVKQPENNPGSTPEMDSTTKLHAVYPNPLSTMQNRAGATISFEIQEKTNVEISIYNLLGQKIKTIASKNFKAGNNTVTWNKKDQAGNNVSAGIYFCKMSTIFKQEIQKIMLVK